MAELHVVSALLNKRSELAGIVSRLEHQLLAHRASLTHVDATMLLFDPDSRPQDVRPRQQRARNSWFRPGECLRLIYDVLRDAPHPVATRELTERIMAVKAIPATDDRRRELIQKTICGSLARTKDTIERVVASGVVQWRLI
jgi:hypothetical protein